MTGQRKFKQGDRVRVNTPGESHHKHEGQVLRELSDGRLVVDLGDVLWNYLPGELKGNPS